MIAADLRKRRPKPHTTWHLDQQRTRAPRSFAFECLELPRRKHIRRRTYGGAGITSNCQARGACCRCDTRLQTNGVGHGGQFAVSPDILRRCKVLLVSLPAKGAPGQAPAFAGMTNPGA